MPIQHSEATRPVRQRRTAWCRAVMALGIAVSVCGCSDVMSPGNAPCGGAQYATAGAILPDAGIDGKSEILVVLIDTLATRYVEPRDKYDRPTWLVFSWLKNADLRTAYFDALSAQTLWVELWAAGATQPGTRVRVRTETAGVTAILRCL